MKDSSLQHSLLFSNFAHSHLALLVIILALLSKTTVQLQYLMDIDILRLFRAALKIPLCKFCYATGSSK